MRWLVAASSLVFACAHDYRSPDPASGPTARVVIENRSADSVYISMTTAAVHIYEGAPDSGRTYLGTVSVANREQEILVAAGRPALFHFSISVIENLNRPTCDVEVGFVPLAGAAYRAIVDEHFRRRCSLRILDSSGDEVAAFESREYLPR